MTKKSFLDSIDVPKPCTANWDEMTGNDKKRFCTSCEKDVYNLSGMPRREARKLVARSAGKICVRYARLPNGKVYTTDQKLHQISRRTSTIAAGVIATTLSLSAMTYAQGKPVAHKIKSKEKAVAEQSKTDEKGTSQISFTIYDPAGAVIPGTEVKLINEKTKKEFIVLTNEIGLAHFGLIPKARFRVEVFYPHFKKYQRYVVISQPIEPNLSIYLEIEGLEIMGEFVVYDYEIPFFEAIVQDDKKTVEKQIVSGFDINTTDKNGTTALHIAVEQGNLEIVKLLLQKGANVNLQDKAKRTPIFMLENNLGNEVEGTLEILQFLISKGADVNVQNEEKETPLMLAAYEEDFEAVKILLKAGANPNLTDNENETAFMKTDSDEIKQLLLRYGARK